jgi:hypothetical protein
MDSALRNKLAAFYGKTSKHSQYQSIPDFITDALDYREQIQSGWRDDRNRLAYVLSQISPRPGETWCDFGANTGFFTLSLAHAFPQTRFVAVEANVEHTNFIAEVISAFGMQNIELIPKAFGLDHLPQIGATNVMLHLNLLHHAGADFDTGAVVDRRTFWPYAERYLSQLRQRTKILIFQMGCNLWGNKQLPLAIPYDDLDMLQRLTALFSATGWALSRIAYPVKKNQNVVYVDLPPEMTSALRTNAPASPVIKDTLRALDLGSHVGEFYHRPICVLSSAPSRV